ncbi:hypothetical protein [Pseudosulfitobacter pseudonitzschiae]|uniref:hypothetical protein n=1 Tax=Pseudosulfitobacter pseudonitzschiae TaxID=1402135 RepID=UPI003B76C080
MRNKIKQYLENRREKGEHFLFPQNDWRYEVDNGDTTAGYEGWLEGKIEIEIDEAVYAIERLLHIASRPFLGDMSEIEFNQAVIELCNSLRISDDEAADRARQFLQVEPEKLVFGEICGNIPSDMVFDLSRIMHLGMVAYEGRCDADKMDKTILDIADRHHIMGDDVTMVKVRLGLEDDPAPGSD